MRRAAAVGLTLLVVAPLITAPLVAQYPFTVTGDAVRQGRFEARALGRDTIVSTYPRAAKEVHFKFALNGRDNEFPPGIEHTINLRPRDGRVSTPVYAFAVEPKPMLPRPEDATEGESGEARVTLRLDLRAVRAAIASRGWYKPPLGDSIRSLTRVTVIGDTDPLVWDINSVRAGAPQDLTDPDGDGVYETTLTFRTEYLRPLDAQGRAIWARSADLSRFPQLTSPEPIVDALYRMSLEELTQLVREDGALAAGAKWPGVWTRDVSLSALLSLAIVVPDAVKTSLRRKVDASGRIIQDTGTGGSWPVSTDRMTWALAAWEVYAVTGDSAWLRESYDVIARSAEADTHAALDPASGLFRGESSFEDWREQSYPRWMQPADIYRSFALGTNAVHHGAYKVLGEMARELGRPADEAARWDSTAAHLRDGIAAAFWMPELQRHAQFLYGRVSLTPSPRYEALGEALLALTDGAVADSAGAASMFAPRGAFGTPTFWPFLAGVPYYHNATVWPFVSAYATWAAARVGNGLGVEYGIATLLRAPALFLTNKENFVAATGHFEGTALNSDRQLWSVAGSLAVQYRVLFGIRFERDRVVFAPVLPEYFRAVSGDPEVRELRGLRYRGATLTVRVRGWSPCGRDYRATLDGATITPLTGAPVREVELPATLTGEHVLEIRVMPCIADYVYGAPVAPDAAPATPQARLEGTAGARAITWDAIPGAERYVVYRDGRPIDTTTVRRHNVVPTRDLAEYQVLALDTVPHASFLSEPVRVVMPSGEGVLAAPGWPVRLERESPAVEVTLQLDERTRIAIDALYSNGSGPINTEDKAAVRTLAIDGNDAGVLVMPQRGAGNWDESGYSNPLVVTLEPGAHVLRVRWDARDENMNGTVSSVLLRGLRVTRLGTERRGPTVTKVDPPDWWVGHTINPVRLLVRGQDLAGARSECGVLACSNLRVSARGTNLFVDVTVPPTTAPGSYPIMLRTPIGETRFTFTVHSPVSRAGRFQGIGPEDVLYLIMPDRFANGDPSNDDPPGAPRITHRDDPRHYHGGDLEGVRQKLPYLKSLGITAVWLTPVTDNVDSIAHRAPVTWARNGYTDYHGYGTVDFYGVEEHFGDLAAYRRLAEEAHALGMKLVMDHVANHAGPEHPWVLDPPTPTWFSPKAPNNWRMASLADPYAAKAVQDSTLRGWFAGILPDFDQSDPDVERYLIQNTLWWAGTIGIDAIRQDTWPYVPRTFWRTWMAAIKREYPQLTVVGEVLDQDALTVSFFEGTKANFDGVRTGLDQVFDFPLQAATRRVFMRGASVRELAQALARDRLYDHPARLITVSENHDMARLINGPGATDEGLLMAYTFQFTVRGSPQLYYGNEIGLDGGEDPDNRRDFPGGFAGDARNAFTAEGRTPREERIFTHLQSLMRLRRERPELRDARTEHLLVEGQQFVYRRGGTVVAINNSAEPVRVRVPGLALARAAVIGGCGVPIAVGTGVELALPGRTACVW